MVILIGGSSHTGKTFLAQKLLEQYRYPYLSIDHLKMGLIRSGQTALTPEMDEALEEYLWPILREMIKTAVENRQNLVLEGCYIPFDWKGSFEKEYLKEIRYCCLVMTEKYIRTHIREIQTYASVIERRLDDSGCVLEELIADNVRHLAQCRKRGLPYLLIDGEYGVEPSRLFEKEEKEKLE